MDSPLLSAITLDFYNNDDEVIATFERNRIPTYLFDSAIALQEALSKEDSDQQQAANLLYKFIVEFFGNKFTVEELKEKSDLMQCMAVLGSILSRATQAAQIYAGQNKENPTRPSPKKK